MKTNNSHVLKKVYGGICVHLFLFWLLGSFLASWLLGFLAFRLLVGLCGFWWLFGFGFSHSLFLSGRWLFGFCGFSLVYAGFGGFGFSHPLLSHFLLPSFLAFAPFLASHILSITSSSLIESSLLQTSWGGAAASPSPARYFLGFLQRFTYTPIEPSLSRASNFARKCCKIQHVL